MNSGVLKRDTGYSLGDEEIPSISYEDHRSTIQAEKETIRALVDKILNENDFHGALAVVKLGLQKSQWLREAYISWYRGLKKISLLDVIYLDWNNIEVFRLLCSLRNFQGWSDENLYELELFAKNAK